LNTVDRAAGVYAALRELQPNCELLLIHSRFRPPERAALASQLAGGLAAGGRIVVATQVLEAGVDVSSRTLFTEVAPWSSIVQRAGRCNRAGKDSGAALVWGRPPKMAAAPYRKADLEVAAGVLTGLEGQAVTSVMLQKAEMKSDRPVYAMLRRKDLLQLFDTTPDLIGADIDIGAWIRDSDETTVFVAWRDLPDGKPPDDSPFPARAELCPAPVHDVRELARPQSTRRVWGYDRLSGRWRFASREEIIPGAVFLADAAAGGYDPGLGWAPQQRAHVSAAPGAAGTTDALGRDDLSYGFSRWVALAEHLADVERAARTLVAEHHGSLAGLPTSLLESVAIAGRFHDLGKAHPVFQETLRGCLGDGESDPGPGPWAKSRRGGGRHSRPYFRHELAGALMLLHPDCPLLSGIGEPDLVAYLVAAHHGKVRVSVRSVAEEAEREPHRILGVQAGDTIPGIAVSRGVIVPPLRLDPGQLMLGMAGEGGESWTARALRLRDRPDVGPFRLAYLETLVRIADWRASSAYREPAQ
jgi:CRISPR-associated endonuclease/helicase Cas3